MRRFKIWKASIDSYRVLDTVTGNVDVVSNLTLKDVVFRVDTKKYLQSSKDGFKDSGDPNDYFAWMEADSLVVNKEAVLYPNKVYYNPFKAMCFRDRVTSQEIFNARLVTTIGNILSYV